jgi:hypothetical protein
MHEDSLHDLLPIAEALAVTPECVAAGFTADGLAMLVRSNLVDGVVDSVTGQVFTSRAALLRLMQMRKIGN